MALKLGKREVRHDPRTILTASILKPITAPASHRIAHNLHDVPMFANDEIGDCTCASQGHRIVAQENSSGQKDIALTDTDVIAAYSAITGFDPRDPSTDQGAYELDVLNYMRKTGMGREKDGTTHTIGAFAKVNTKNIAEVKLAHYVFGGLKVCFNLPISASDQINAGQPWDVVPGSRSRAGSWGGHSTYSVGYDATGITLYTWGAEQRASWAFVARYADECYALVSEDYLRPKSGHSPQGLDVDELNRQLAAI